MDWFMSWNTNRSPPFSFQWVGRGREKSAREHKHQMENHHLSTQGEYKKNERRYQVSFKNNKKK
jgi:hypothetical protein